MNTLSILHLEDNALDAELIQSHLSRGGIDCSILRVDTEEEFLQALRSHRFDMVLADYYLPSFDGLTALELLRNEGHHEMPFLFISGVLGEEFAVEALKRGATDYVLKQRLERIAPAVRRAAIEAYERQERQRIALELASTQETFEFVAEETGIGICHLDLHHNQMRANSRGMEHFWLTRSCSTWSPSTGNSSFGLELLLHRIHPDDRERIQSAFLDALQNKKGCQVDCRTVSPITNEVKWIRTLGRGIYARNGTPLRMDAITMDITSQKKHEGALNEARLQAEAANRMKDEFLATISHELRTPLNAILGYAQLLKRKSNKGEELQKGLEVIERNARLQAKLIEDLLDVSRIISGKLKLEDEKVPLTNIIKAVIDSIRPIAQGKEIQLVEEHTNSEFAVRGDSTRLQQILWNLVSNAAKFVHQGGRITISAHQRGIASVEVTIADNGPGIDAELLPYIFERFRQADSSSTRSHGGLGLGLSIVKHLTEMHGGSVRAESKGKGQGALFAVTLPLASNSVEPQCPQRAVTYEAPEVAVLSSYSFRGKRILVVDDDSDARNLLKVLLEELEAEVVVASSSQEALLMFSQESPHLVISDIGMPEEDGYTFVRSLRSFPSENERSVPAIALTAFARSEDRRKALASGFQSHLAKPVQPLLLLQEMVRLLYQVPLSETQSF